MNDYIVRATAADHSIRAFAITSKNIVEEARKDHNTSPVITAALGRLLSGAAMMGTMMKGEKDLLTVQIQCQGPAQGLTVTADSAGHVKGFPRVADVALPPNALGKLDVGGALGLGVMSVIKDMGLKEPYVGQIALQTGEIAEDLTYYFATSEQVPSAVGLGVLVDVDGSVKQAGGFFSPSENSTVATGGFRVTVACMPSILFNAFSTCMRQWLHIMPSTLNSFFMIVSVGGSTSLFSSPSCILFRFSSRLLLTTLTLLNAMAAPAIIGFSRKPLMG